MDVDRFLIDTRVLLEEIPLPPLYVKGNVSGNFRSTYSYIPSLLWLYIICKENFFWRGP